MTKAFSHVPQCVSIKLEQNYFQCSFGVKVTFSGSLGKLRLKKFPRESQRFKRVNSCYMILDKMHSIVYFFRNANAKTV